MHAKRKILIISPFFFTLLFVMAVVFAYRKETFAVRSLDEILQTGILRVVSENSSTGIAIQGKDISGFQYEILKLFADTLGVELEVFIKNDLQTCILDLNKGRYDIITRFIPTTTEWINEVSFSVPLLISRQMLVQHIHSGQERERIHFQRQLAEDTICIPLHSPHKMRLINLSKEIADTIYLVEIPEQTPEQLVQLVSEGKIRNTICHEQLARKLCRDYPNIDASVPVSLAQPYSWAVNKQSAGLLDKLNEFLNQFIGSTAYWNLYRKYYQGV